MFGNCQGVFMIGQSLFMSKPPPHQKPPFCVFPPLHPLNDANLHVCSTSQDSRRGGRGREGGMKGAGVGKSTGEGGDRERERQAKLQVWSKCHSWPSPAGVRVPFYTINLWLWFPHVHLTISFFSSMNQSFSLKAFSLLLPSPPPRFISNVGFLFTLRDVKALFLL